MVCIVSYLAGSATSDRRNRKSRRNHLLYFFHTIERCSAMFPTMSRIVSHPRFDLSRHFRTHTLVHQFVNINKSVTAAAVHNTSSSRQQNGLGRRSRRTNISGRDLRAAGGTTTNTNGTAAPPFDATRCHCCVCCCCSRRRRWEQVESIWSCQTSRGRYESRPMRIMNFRDRLDSDLICCFPFALAYYTVHDTHSLTHSFFAAALHQLRIIYSSRVQGHRCVIGR